LTHDLKAAVLAAEKRRCAAMLANDAKALAELLDRRLQFVHATGAVDDREAYLAKIAAGRIDYLDIAWSEEAVTPLTTDAALLTGRMTTDVSVEGVGKRLSNRVITVWNESDGEWRLIAFQSTPIAG
jgi:hypothetical protein